MSGYRVRNEELPNDAFVVVRGGLLEINSLRADAVAAQRRFGEFGISVFGAEDEDALDDLARDRMARYRALTVMTAGALRAAGLEVVPTFRRPHFTVLLPDLEPDLRRLMSCENVVRLNPHWHGRR